MLVLQQRRVDRVMAEVGVGDLRPHLLEKGRARIGRDHVEVGIGGIQRLGILAHPLDRLLGVVGKADEEAGHGADAQAAAEEDELPLAVVGDQGAMVVSQDVGVGPLHAHRDARQPHGAQQPQRLRRQQVGAGFDGELDLPRQAADLLGQPRHLGAVQAEERIAKLEGTETPAADVVPHLLGHRFRAAKAGRVVQHDVGTIVALHRAAAAGLNQRRGKPRKVVADAELPRPKRRPVGQRQAVEVLQGAQLHGRPRPGQHLVELPQQLLGLALDHGHAQVAEKLRQHRGRRADHQHPRRRIAPQQSGHHVALQRERQQRRIEDVQIRAGGKPVLGILDAVSEAGEDRRQVGEQQRHRPAVAGVKPANHPAAQRAVAGVLADAETAGEILRDVIFSRIPENDVHGRKRG